MGGQGDYQEWLKELDEFSAHIRAVAGEYSSDVVVGRRRIAEYDEAHKVPVIGRNADGVYTWGIAP